MTSADRPAPEPLAESGAGGTADLVRRMVAGEDAAFEELYRRSRRSVEAFIRRRLPAHFHRRLSIADVLQDVHLVAYQRRTSFEHRGSDSFRNWLLRIAELKLKEIGRRHAGAARRAVGREVSHGGRPDTVQFVGGLPSPSQHAIERETVRCANDALEALPPTHREIIRLTREKRRTVREAAELTGRSYQATRKLLSRALAGFSREFARRRSVR